MKKASWEARAWKSRSGGRAQKKKRQIRMATLKLLYRTIPAGGGSLGRQKSTKAATTSSVISFQVATVTFKRATTLWMMVGSSLPPTDGIAG